MYDISMFMCKEHPFESLRSLALFESADFQQCSHACTNHPQINGNGNEYPYIIF